jgi:hypothetical protein
MIAVIGVFAAGVLTGAAAIVLYGYTLTRIADDGEGYGPR